MDISIMTTTEYLIELIAAKRDMRAALLEKGVQTWGGLNIYPEAIDKINQSVDELVVEPDMRFGFNQWVISPILDMSLTSSLEGMFISSKDLKQVYLSNTSHIRNMRSAFRNCEALTDVYGLEIGGGDITNLFSLCKSLVKPPIINLSNVTSITSLFSYCESLQEVTFEGDPSSIKSYSYAFNNVKSGGKLYYDGNYDYSLILSILPPTWEAIPI